MVWHIQGYLYFSVEFYRDGYPWTLIISNYCIFYVCDLLNFLKTLWVFLCMYFLFCYFTALVLIAFLLSLLDSPSKQQLNVQMNSSFSFSVIYSFFLCAHVIYQTMSKTEDGKYLNIILFYRMKWWYNHLIGRCLKNYSEYYFQIHIVFCLF